MLKHDPGERRETQVDDEDTWAEAGFNYEPVTDRAAELLAGAIDMHVHIGPDSMGARRMDLLRIVLKAREARVRSLVLKSHDFPTVLLADFAQRFCEPVRIFGGITLNPSVGGLNPAAVEASAKLGARVVWMPTRSSFRPGGNETGRLAGTRVLDQDGNLSPQVCEILDLVKAHNLVLGTGHLPSNEVFAVVNEANRRGIRKVLVNHPLTKATGVSLPLAEQKALVDIGAYIEHCFVATMPCHDRLDPRTIVEAVKYVGAERSILASDFGQLHNPDPVEGMRMFIATMLKFGVTEDDIIKMTRINPARLLSMDEM